MLNDILCTIQTRFFGRRPSGVWCRSVSSTCLDTTTLCWWGHRFSTPVCGKYWMSQVGLVHKVFLKPSFVPIVLVIPLKVGLVLQEGVLFDATLLMWVLKRTCPAVHKHLQQHGVEPLMFATDWLMCLFTRHLPFNTLLRVWDLFFCYGSYQMGLLNSFILFKCKLKIEKHAHTVYIYFF